MNPVFDRECYGLRALRRATLNGYDVTLLPAEAADVVAEVERLRDTVASLRASVPPTHPSDYGHEAWAEVERLRDTVASLRASVPPTHPSDYGHEAWAETVRTAVAAERAAVVAWLNGCATEGFILLRINEACDAEKWALAIERGEHRREGDE